MDINRYIHYAFGENAEWSVGKGAETLQKVRTSTAVEMEENDSNPSINLNAP